MHRLFFALLPDANATAAIARVATNLRREHGDGGWIEPGKWHITLAYLGTWPELPAEFAQRAAAAAARVQSAPATVRLDYIDSFSGERRPWFLGVARAPAATALATELRARLREADVAYDPRPFIPHLTLRRARESAPAVAISPISWTAYELCLLHSPPGATAYAVLARQDLAPVTTP
jgi:RNA 2',3'-cyclic 3'-phosphodiesterase